MSALNVLGQPLQPCGYSPLTGYFRDGCCHTDPGDHGLHVVCVIVTQRFLDFSRSRGNDLITPRPEYQFPGLSAGDRWCLCARRWVEAWEHGVAPRVILASTHLNALGVVPLAELRAYAEDPA